MIGAKVTADTAGGIPMTRPENVAVPPRRSEYTLEEETAEKKVTLFET